MKAKTKFILFSDDMCDTEFVRVLEDEHLLTAYIKTMARLFPTKYCYWHINNVHRIKDMAGYVGVDITSFERLLDMLNEYHYLIVEKNYIKITEITLTNKYTNK